ncbi:MAG: prepilin peptidase [Myxococcaceae bacterium]
MSLLILTWIFITGACIGSFINVVILRLQSSEHSFLTKRSYCYNCRKTLLWRDMVPILSWFYLKGRCRYCHHRFSYRYSLIELSVGILALLCMDSPQIFIFCTMLLAIGLIDLDTWMIPLQLPAIITATGLLFGYRESLDLFYARLIGCLVGFAFFALFLLASTWILRRLKRLGPDEHSMGWGDPILIAAIGANLGWFWLPWMVLLASLQGIILYCLFSFKRAPQADDDWVPPQMSLPFGPFLALASVEICIFNML